MTDYDRAALIVSYTRETFIPVAVSGLIQSSAVPTGVRADESTFLDPQSGVLTIREAVDIQPVVESILDAIDSHLVIKNADLVMSNADLERVKREAGAAALRDFAEGTEIAYPEELFAPMSKCDHDDVNAVLRTLAGVSRDRISADMMRFAATLARDAAEDIERGE